MCHCILSAIEKIQITELDKLYQCSFAFFSVKSISEN